MAEDEMVGEHHRLNGHEFEQTSGGREGQGSLGCCRPWDHKELVMTKRLMLSFFFHMLKLASVVFCYLQLIALNFLN